MSTYTDLKNVVKETVEVNYAANDRSTNQKVKFLNEENVFWGTLHGKIGDDVKINDTTLSGATITKSKLKDVQLDGVTLDNCQSLIDLSATDVVLDTKIDASLAEAKYDIGLVDQSLKNVSADLQYKIDHIDKDYYIVSAYSTLLTELSTKEITDVANLQGQINKTAQDIIACGLQERQDFALLSAANISTVEQLSVELKGDIAANKILIDEISGKINDSSAAISFLSNDISVRLNEVDDRRAVGDYNLKLDINALSIDVDRKLSNSGGSSLSIELYALSGSAEISCGAISSLALSKSDVYLSTDTDGKWLSTLTINKISLEKYKDLEAHGQIKDDQLYFVDEEQINAYNKAIISVLTPIDSAISSKYCATNKKYVDDSISNSIAQTYSDNVKTKSTNLSSYIYTKFITGEYDLDNVRDAMLSILTILANR